MPFARKGQAAAVFTARIPKREFAVVVEPSYTVGHPVGPHWQPGVEQ